MADPLGELTRAGVAIWLDDLSRARLVEGSLARLIRDRRVVGVTTNPTIFAKAISGSDHYDRQLRELAEEGADVEDAQRMLTTRDVAWACDLLRPAYDASGGVDGRGPSRSTPGSRTRWRGRLPRPVRCGGRWTGPTCSSRSRPGPPACGVVNTMPETTLLAVADHGALRGAMVRPGYDDAARTMATLADLGIDADDVMRTLEHDGLDTFQASWSALADTLEHKLVAARRGGGEDGPT